MKPTKNKLAELVLSDEPQQTIKNTATYRGIGLHTGREINLTFKPAKENNGIVFCRIDLPNRPIIPADLKYVIDCKRRTKLGLSNKIIVESTEHILAAIRGVGVDNIIIEMDGPEIPISDGSPIEFVEVLQNCKIVAQKAKRKDIIIKKTIIVEASKNIKLSISKHKSLRIQYYYRYNDFISKATLIGLDNFEKDFAAARTFCFYEELDEIKKKLKGLNYYNVLIIKDKKIINKSPLRFGNEFAKHKIVDIIGDLTLLGYPIKGKISADFSGHQTNFELAKKIREAIKQNGTI